MPPTVVGVGAVATGTTTITPAKPAGIAADDILLDIAESVGGQNYTLAGGWAHVTGSPVVQGTNTQLTVAWRRYDGVFGAPAMSGTTDHAIGRMIAVRGCPTTGNPWDVVTVSVEAVSDTSATWPSPAQTTVPDTLVLMIMATSADIATAQVSTVTNGNLTSITEQIDNATATGNGGVVICYSGTFAGPGTIGAATATLTTAAFKAGMTLAMKNASAGIPQTLQRSPRPREEQQVAGPYAQPHISTQILPGG
jgi:hypothetical protein